MVIIVQRHPDFSNQYDVFGEPAPTIIDVDYGGVDLSDPKEFAEWAEGHMAEAESLRQQGELVAAFTLENLVREAQFDYLGEEI